MFPKVKPMDFALSVVPLFAFCLNGICGEDDSKGSFLHRHRRETNSTGSGAFFDDPNNTAMYLVLPIMVLVYGGCACIYCCHRCREYLEEKQPLTVIKLKIQGKSFDEIKKIREKEKEKQITEPKPQDMFPDSSDRPHSVQSVPEPTNTINYLNVEDRQRSVLSSPGIGYGSCPVTSSAKNDNEEKTKADDKSHPFTIQSEEDMRVSSQISSVNTDRRDSGIQDDRDGDLDRHYASTLSRCHSSKSFGSVSLRSELLTAAYIHKQEDDGGSIYPNWSELNGISAHKTPPPPAEYVIDSCSARLLPEKASASTAVRALPPQIDTAAAAAEEKVKMAVITNTFPSETNHALPPQIDTAAAAAEEKVKMAVITNTFPSETNHALPPQIDTAASAAEEKVKMAVITNTFPSETNHAPEQNKTSLPVTYPDIISSTEHLDSDLNSNSSDKGIFKQSTKNKLQAVYNLNKSRKNSKRRENSISRDKKELFSDIISDDGMSNQNKNKSKLRQESHRKIDYLDETPQINGRFRMYYQNRRLTQNVENGNQSSVPTVSAAIKDTKINPIHIGMSSDGNVKVTEQNKRPRVTNVRQLYYPYWN